MSDIIITPKFRLSFPWLFEAQPPMAGSAGPAMYSLVALFDKSTDLSLLKSAASAAANAMWPDKTKRPANFRTPFRNGDEKQLDGYAGMIYITAKSKTRPGVVDQNVKPIMSQDVLYAGCYCIAQVTCYAYSKAGNAGVAFGLSNVQKVADGEPFTARSKPEDVFKAVAGAQKSAATKTAADSVDEWAAAGAPTSEPDL